MKETTFFPFKTRFIALLGLLFTTVLNAQKTLEMDALIEAATMHVPTAAQQPLIEEANRLALAQLRANYLPQTSLNGQATWQSEVTALPIQLPNFEVPTLSKDQYRLTLDVLQPIWDGGQIAHQSHVQRANTNVELQRMAVEQYAVREQVIQLYCAALLAERQARSVAFLRKDVAAKRARTDEQVRNGTAIPAHVSAFDARLLELDQQHDDALARRLAALDGMALLTGIALGEGDSLLASPPAVNATSERPELILFRMQQTALQAQSNAITVRNMPRINAIATLGYGRPGLNFLANEFSPYAIFGANFKWNLGGFYNGAGSKEQQQLRIMQERIRHQSQQFELMNQVKASQQNREVERLEKSLARDQKILELRQQIAATAAIQLDNGTTTPSDYLAELTQVAQARIGADLHAVQLLQAQWLQHHINANK